MIMDNQKCQNKIDLLKNINKVISQESECSLTNETSVLSNSVKDQNNYIESDDQLELQDQEDDDTEADDQEEDDIEADEELEQGDQNNYIESDEELQDQEDDYTESDEELETQYYHGTKRRFMIQPVGWGQQDEYEASDNEASMEMNEANESQSEEFNTGNDTVEYDSDGPELKRIKRESASPSMSELKRYSESGRVLSEGFIETQSDVRSEIPDKSDLIYGLHSGLVASLKRERYLKSIAQIRLQNNVNLNEALEQQAEMISALETQLTAAKNQLRKIVATTSKPFTKKGHSKGGYRGKNFIPNFRGRGRNNRKAL